MSFQQMSFIMRSSSFRVMEQYKMGNWPYRDVDKLEVDQKTGTKRIEKLRRRLTPQRLK